MPWPGPGTTCRCEPSSTCCGRSPVAQERRPGIGPSRPSLPTGFQLPAGPSVGDVAGGSARRRAGTLPLAPIAGVAPPQLPDVSRRMADRLDRETPPATGDELWTAGYILFGLRHPPAEVGPIMRGVRRMRESATYQAIL